MRGFGHNRAKTKPTKQKEHYPRGGRKKLLSHVCCVVLLSVNESYSIFPFVVDINTEILL